MPWQSKGLLTPFHPIPKTNKTFSGEDARTPRQVTMCPKRDSSSVSALAKRPLVGTETIKPVASGRITVLKVIHSGLIHGFNLSTTTDSNNYTQYAV